MLFSVMSFHGWGVERKNALGRRDPTATGFHGFAIVPVSKRNLDQSKVPKQTPDGPIILSQGSNMTEQLLKDRQNRLIGKIKTGSFGVLELRDASNRLRGKYDPRTNRTTDAQNRVVGQGNLLTTLL